ncbi:MAG: hypothetical protein ACLGGV_09010 [Bacteroidia bacterium]
MKHSTIFIFLFFVSCISINIGTNDYSFLKESDIKRIKNFEPSVFNLDFKNDSLVSIYEIDHSIIQENVLKNNKYTWIHFWRPYCSKEACVNINIYSNAAKKHDNLKLLLTSQTYDFPQIQGTFELTNYPLPIFVVKNSSYGEKVREAKRQITSKLISKEVLADEELFADDILFYGNKVIYVGNSLDYQLDSIISLTGK